MPFIPRARTRHKYNAKKVEYDGIRFDSKLEGDYYLFLKILQERGKILRFLRQIPFHLPGGTIYRVDFMELWADGNLIFTDVKGMETAEFKLKKSQVEELYSPITINVVKKGDF